MNIQQHQIVINSALDEKDRLQRRIAKLDEAILESRGFINGYNAALADIHAQTQARAEDTPLAAAAEPQPLGAGDETQPPPDTTEPAPFVPTDTPPAAQQDDAHGAAPDP